MNYLLNVTQFQFVLLSKQVSLLLRYRNTCVDPEFFWGQMDIIASKGRWVQDQSSTTLPRQFNTVDFPFDLGMDHSFRTTRPRSVFHTHNIWSGVIPCHDLGAWITCKHEAYFSPQ